MPPEKSHQERVEISNILLSKVSLNLTLTIEIFFLGFAWSKRGLDVDGCHLNLDQREGSRTGLEGRKSPPPKSEKLTPHSSSSAIGAESMTFDNKSLFLSSGPQLDADIAANLSQRKIELRQKKEEEEVEEEKEEVSRRLCQYKEVFPLPSIPLKDFGHSCLRSFF